MALDLDLVHPEVRAKMGTVRRRWRDRLDPVERTYLETLTELGGSLRSVAEMEAAAAVLNPMFDARGRRTGAGDDEGVARLDAIAAEILWAAKGVRSSRSGMAVDVCLELMWTAYEKARAELEKG